MEARGVEKAQSRCWPLISIIIIIIIIIIIKIIDHYILDNNNNNNNIIIIIIIILYECHQGTLIINMIINHDHNAMQ